MRNNSNTVFSAILASTFFFTSTLLAQGLPTGKRLMPYEGTLWQNGEAVNGSCDFIFLLCNKKDAQDCRLLDYSASADPFDINNHGVGVVWVGTHTDQNDAPVTVVQGQFSVMLGETQPLVDEVFSTSELYLGIAVRRSASEDDFVELTNRQRITPDPYVHSRQGGIDYFIIPRGAVMHFNLPTCPTGWSQLTEATGRVLVGLHSGGNLGGTQGEALADQGIREITEVPSHSHRVDPPSANTNNDSHSHTYSSGTGGFGYGRTGHVADYDSKSSNTSSDTHNHAINIGPFDSASAGVPAVDVTMPYLQLLVCIKD